MDELIISVFCEIDNFCGKFIPYMEQHWLLFTVGLRIYCADRMKTWAGRQKSLAEGDLEWIFACYWARSEQ